MSCFKLELVAAFSTLVQSMVQIAVALLVVLVHTCNLDHLQPSGNPLIVLLYTAYFYNTECGGSRVPVSWTGTSATAAIMLSGTPFTADRTYNFMLVYLILGICLFITSLLLIAGAANGVRGAACYTFRAPWVVTCALTLLVDVVALVFYTVDIPKSMTMADLLSYIAATSTGIQTNLVTYAWVPAAIIAAYLSRFIVIWFLNAVLLIAVIYRGHLQYYKGSEKVQHEVVNMPKDKDNYMESTGIPLADICHQRSSPDHLHQRSSPDHLHQRSSPSVVTLQNASSLAPAQVQSSITPAHRQNGVVPPPPPAMPNAQGMGGPNQTGFTAVDSNRETAIEKHTAQRVPDISRRISNNSANRAEFRGQMPWSYLNEVVAQPHRMRDQLPEDEELPPVPVPDYTLHHPKKYRPKVSRDSSDASSGRRPVPNNWGGKEVLY